MWMIGSDGLIANLQNSFDDASYHRQLQHDSRHHPIYNEVGPVKTNLSEHFFRSVFSSLV